MSVYQSPPVTVLAVVVFHTGIVKRDRCSITVPVRLLSRDLKSVAQIVCHLSMFEQHCT